MSIELGDRARALENDYFRKREQELIDRLKGHMAVENAKSIGVKCPKCEGTLKEADFQKVKLDICDKCHGIWFDAGELAQVLDHDKEGGWLDKLFG